MSYVLKHHDEFDRLEYQSTLPNYDYKSELNALKINDGDKILDAACGTGVVTRYLKETYPNSHITGCDIGIENLEKAQIKAAGLDIDFRFKDLTNLQFNDNSFDIVICRYAIQHITKGLRAKAISEIYRVLRPKGKFLCIDFDGTLHNIYPRNKIIDPWLNLIEKNETIDLRIGRKLPYLLNKAGFEYISHDIKALSFSGSGMDEEISQMTQRFINAKEFIIKEIGDEVTAEKFMLSFLETLNTPGVTYFYNKFIVSGTKKPTLKLMNE